MKIATLIPTMCLVFIASFMNDGLRGPSAESDDIFGTIEIAEQKPVADAVAELNSLSSNHVVGKNQPALTVDELNAAILKWFENAGFQNELDKDDFPADPKQIREGFNEIIETGVLDAGSELQFATGYWSADSVYKVWWIDLTVAKYTLRIRDRTLSGRKQTLAEKAEKNRERKEMQKLLIEHYKSKASEK